MENLNITDKKNEHTEIDIGNLPIEEVERNSIAEEEKSAGILMKMDKYERVTEKGVPLLKRVSFSLPEGKMTALLGLSGDGKSTLMDGIAGLCSPSHKTYGEVYVKGKSGALEKRKAEEWFNRVNYTQQSMIEYKKIPAYDVLCSIAKCYGKEEQEVDDYMSMLRISKVKKVHFDNLSGGEQRRAMVIAGLLAQKELNIWDEPLTGLDSEMARVILSMMKKSQSTNLVTVHQISEDLMRRFDHVILMHRSTIIYSGPADEIKKYFADKGIEFPADAFYVNYLMQLCAENSDNHTDIKNIEIFNTLANGILHSSCGENAGENVLFTRKQLKLSFTRIMEILKRSLYMDRLFKGSSIVFCIFFTILFSIMFSIRKLSLLGNCKKINDFYSIALGVNVSSAIFIPKALELAKQRIAEHSDMESYFVYLSSVHKMMANAAWISILTSVFNPLIFMVGCVGGLIFPSKLLDIDFNRRCRSNIQGKQFTAGDFMGAIITDVLLKSTAVIFVIFVVVYIICVKQTDESISNVMTIGHTIPIVLLLFTSIIIGMYSIIMNFSPIPLKLFSLIGILYIFIFQIVPSFIFNNMIPTNSKLADTQFNYSMSIFTSENIELIRECIDKSNMFFSNISDNKKKMVLAFANLVFMLSRVFILLDPSLFFNQILEKVALYLNMLTMGTEAGPKSYKVFAKWYAHFYRYFNYQVSELNADIDELNMKRHKHYLKKLVTGVSSYSDGLLGCDPHEVLNNEDSLIGISIWRLMWSILKFWLFPGIVLIAVSLYTYRRMQPKIRS
ncbi:hypothetical protein NEAUS06_1053 [Nematocida ausubeli]|nr:hypothetical protein NEAUS06_1053 [Nematocida ausubeli]